MPGGVAGYDSRPEGTAIPLGQRVHSDGPQITRDGLAAPDGPDAKGRSHIAPDGLQHRRLDAPRWNPVMAAARPRLDDRIGGMEIRRLVPGAHQPDRTALRILVCATNTQGRLERFNKRTVLNAARGRH